MMTLIEIPYPAKMIISSEILKFLPDIILVNEKGYGKTATFEVSEDLMRITMIPDSTKIESAPVLDEASQRVIAEAKAETKTWVNNYLEGQGELAELKKRITSGEVTVSA